MFGNVRELCSDYLCYSLPIGSVTDPTGPVFPSLPQIRVIRCADFNDDENVLQRSRDIEIPPKFVIF